MTIFLISQAQVLTVQYMSRTVAYKQAALNAIAYLMKVGSIKSRIINS